MNLPTSFRSDMLAKLGDKYQDFESVLKQPSPTSIRINKNKFNNNLPSNKVPWCEFGYYLDERPIFTLDPSFHAGAYYVQEASSMFIWYLLEKICTNNRDIKILDLCASPGGKSSLIATYLNHQGLLVANEVIKNRAYTLKYNLSKEGYANVMVSNNDPKDFSELIDFFDIILVDAPCSGEGMFRKDANAICEWSEDSVQNCSARQKRILADVWPALKSGGHLIYSTCTYNDKENIDNIKWLKEQFSCKDIEIDIDPSWNIEKIVKESQIGYQFYPHKVLGEGFFTAVVQKDISENKNQDRYKPSSKNLTIMDKKMVVNVKDWIDCDGFTFFTDKTGNVHAISEDLFSTAITLSNYLKLIYCGITVGELNKTILIPDQSLAFSLNVSKKIQKFDLSKLDALLYLKKELPAINSEYRSWVLMTYQNLGLGWAKNLGNRINNYLPNEYKIRMSLDPIVDN